FLCWQNTTAASDRTDATSATTTATRRRLLLAEHASDPIPILLSNPARMARSGGAHGSTTPAQPRGSRQSVRWGATEPASLDNNPAGAARVRVTAGRYRQANFTTQLLRCRPRRRPRSRRGVGRGRAKWVE